MAKIRENLNFLKDSQVQGGSTSVRGKIFEGFKNRTNAAKTTISS